MTQEPYIRSLDLAALQYKLALQVGCAAHTGVLQQRLIGFQFGGLAIEKDDLVLSADDSALASTALQHCAEFTLAVAVDTAFEQLIPNRFNSTDAAIVTAAIIARILRNAFTHNPFFPRWDCRNPNYLGLFEIPDVITIDTTTLNGHDVDWRHYGGPLALLRFLRHCQELLASFDNAA